MKEGSAPAAVKDGSAPAAVKDGSAPAEPPRQSLRTSSSPSAYSTKTPR